MDKPKRKYRVSRGKHHADITIREYVEWGKGETFKEKPRQIGEIRTG